MPNANIRANILTDKDTGQETPFTNIVSTFDSVADMQSSIGLRVGQKVRTLGYYEPGDGGGNDYEIVAAGTGTDDGGSFIDLSGSGLQAKGLFGGGVNIRHFGVQHNVPNESGFRAAFKFGADGLSIPGGRHIYSGTTPISEITDNNIRLFRIEDSRGYDATIEVQEDTYLVELDLYMQEVIFKGINFVGGLGAYRNNRTGGNSADAVRTIVDRCKFIGYKECAYSTQSDDYPFQSFTNNKFVCEEGFNTIGIALNGLTDGLKIVNNNFLNNEYHIRVPSHSANSNISGNTFSNRGAAKKADIWIVPVYDLTRTASGACLNINKNKFGSEFLPDGIPRILVANSSGLATNIDRPDFANTANTVYGAFIKENGFGQNASWGGSIVKSYIKEFVANRIENNIIKSGLENIKYILEYDTLPTFYQQARNVIEGNKNGNGAFYHLPVTNGIDRVNSSLSNWGEGFSSEINSETNYIDVYRNYNTATIYGGAVTVTPIPNPDFGVNSGALVKYNASGNEWLSGSANFPNASNITDNQGEYLVLEMDVKKSDNNPLEKINVNIVELGANQDILLQTMRVPEKYTRVQAVVKIPEIVDATPNYRIIITANGYSSTSNEFELYNIALYVANSPINTKHLRTVDDKWDTPHLVMGNTHLWVDDSGRLRIKTGAPTSSTDGVIVGLQS